MLHDGADNNWRSAFFMPASADTGKWPTVASRDICTLCTSIVCIAGCWGTCATSLGASKSSLLSFLWFMTAPPPLFHTQSLSAGIIKFRTWFHDCAGGDVPWPGVDSTPGAPRPPLGPAKPRQVVMDRLSQHTLQCKACSAALKWVQRLQVRLRRGEIVRNHSREVACLWTLGQ
jgi:hypothetical protein